MTPLELSLADLTAAVRSGALSAVETVEASVGAIEERWELNAVLTLCAEEAMARARAGVSGPLAGVPLLVKDLFDTAGVRTTYGSEIYADYVPPATAAAVDRLERAGAIVVGKTNLFEFAWGTTGENAHWGETINPRDPELTTGGSSSGNAAALAAGLGPLALGSDTGGSIRMPSACCSTVGFKPTHGRISTAGCYPLCPSFDTIGPMARTAADCAFAWSVLTGAPVPASRLAGLTIGLLTAPPRLGPGEAPEADEGAKAFVQRLESLGARVVEAELPVPGSDTWPLFYREAAASHRATFPERKDEYGPVLQAKLAAAVRVGAAEAGDALESIRRWRVEAARSAPDLYVSPTLEGEIPAAATPELDVRLRMSSFTRPFNVLGWPAIALGGLQLAGLEDATVLGAALAWEEAYGPVGR